jgi:hypothetical protein
MVTIAAHAPERKIAPNGRISVGPQRSRCRLYSERSLADTTAESRSSVKHANHLWTFCLVLFLALAVVPAHLPAQTPPTAGANAPKGAAADAKADPAQIFQHGHDALNRGQLDEAELDFRSALTIDPKAGAAYGNLGVSYMRRKQRSWKRRTTSKSKPKRALH